MDRRGSTRQVIFSGCAIGSGDSVRCMQLREKTVLITGASGGIGEAAAHELARVGARPVLVARRAEELRRVAAALQESYDITAPICAADITRAADRERLRDFVENEVGRLDVLVNNAGITAHGRFDESEPDVLRRAMELNFFAAVELTRLLLPELKRAPGDKAVLLVSTPSGLYGVPGRFAYSASKAAGHVWMETLRLELADDHIQCNIFCPGYTATALRTSGLAADGSILKEEQSKHAKSPEHAAVKLREALEKNRRITLTNLQGRVVYWLRTLAPGLLEGLMRKKLKKDFEKKRV